MQDQTPKSPKVPDNQQVNEAVEESFPASDPPAYSTPHAEYQSAAVDDRRVLAGTWVVVAITAILLISLISLAF